MFLALLTIAELPGCEVEQIADNPLQGMLDRNCMTEGYNAEAKMLNRDHAVSGCRLAYHSIAGKAASACTPLIGDCTDWLLVMLGLLRPQGYPEIHI